MGRILIAVIAFCVVGIIVVVAVVALHDPTPKPPATPSPVPAQPPAPLVTADDLAAAYDANEVAADMQYKGKVVRVTGVVESIGKDFLYDTPYVTLSGGRWGVQCSFDKSQVPHLAKLSKGQTVTIQGEVRGIVVFGVYLNQCNLI